jgi:hypothetical protein
MGFRKGETKIGGTFGMWTVINPGSPKSECKCSCGAIKMVRNADLIMGKSKSCGHPYGIRFCKHGKSRTKLNTVWLGMRKRCLTPTCKNFRWYGARGIKICQEWDSYERFEEWSLKSGYAPGLSIDRINNDGNYEPSNCRWATLLEQNNNSRWNIVIAFGGKRQTLAQWARELNVPYNKMRYRYHHGWTNEEVLYGRKA